VGVLLAKDQDVHGRPILLSGEGPSGSRAALEGAGSAMIGISIFLITESPPSGLDRSLP
jgi:hypothetical protein